MPHLPIETPALSQSRPAADANQIGADRVSPPPDTEDDDRVLLDLLRHEAAACRTLARLDLDDAAAAIGGTCSTRLRFLLRVLPQALGARPVIYFPGTRIVSFDERWLLSVIAARRRGDSDSLAFLLQRRIPSAKLRAIVRLLPDPSDQTARSVLIA